MEQFIPGDHDPFPLQNFCFSHANLPNTYSTYQLSKFCKKTGKNYFITTLSSTVQKIVCNGEVSGYFISWKNYTNDQEVIGASNTVLIKAGNKVRFSQNHGRIASRQTLYSKRYSIGSYIPKTDDPFGEFFTRISKDEVSQERIEASQSKINRAQLLSEQGMHEAFERYLG